MKLIIGIASIPDDVSVKALVPGKIILDIDEENNKLDLPVGIIQNSDTDKILESALEFIKNFANKVDDDANV